MSVDANPVQSVLVLCGVKWWHKCFYCYVSGLQIQKYTDPDIMGWSFNYSRSFTVLIEFSQTEYEWVRSDKIPCYDVCGYADTECGYSSCEFLVHWPLHVWQNSDQTTLPGKMHLFLTVSTSPIRLTNGTVFFKGWSNLQRSVDFGCRTSLTEITVCYFYYHYYYYYCYYDYLS